MPRAALAMGSAAYEGKLYCIGGTSIDFDVAYDNLRIYQP